MTVKTSFTDPKFFKILLGYPDIEIEGFFLSPHNNYFWIENFKFQKILVPIFRKSSQNYFEIWKKICSVGLLKENRVLFLKNYITKRRPTTVVDSRSREETCPLLWKVWKALSNGSTLLHAHPRVVSSGFTTLSKDEVCEVVHAAHQSTFK